MQNRFINKETFKSFVHGHWPLLVIILVYGLIFCSVSLVNHYNFRTYAWDLGIRNNAIYDYAHFRWNEGVLLVHKFENLLSDHFQLLPILISPFYWIFGSYTMLIFQIFAILFGGIGVYVYIRKYSGSKKFANLAAIHFFSIWAIYSALAFDFHDNVVGAMFVPWFLYFIRYDKWAKASIMFALVLISKENMSLWMFFICLGLLVLHRKEQLKLKNISFFAVISIFYFFVVMYYIMPSLANEGQGYMHFEYSALGDNFGEAILTIIQRPGYIFSLLFENHINAKSAIGTKSELHFVVLLSGGVFLFFKPQYLIMLIPIYAQKLFNDDPGKWGINAHYSIEFVPILTIAAFTWILEKRSRLKFLFAYILVAVTIITSGSVLDRRVSKWYNSVNHQFYKKEHYIRDFDVNGMHKILNNIPDDAIVSAQTMLVPHIALRDKIYLFPDVGDAEYIVLLTADDNTYPLNRENYLEEIEKYRNNDEWEIFLENDYALLFKRKNYPQ